MRRGGGEEKEHRKWRWVRCGAAFRSEFFFFFPCLFSLSLLQGLNHDKKEQMAAAIRDPRQHLPA